MAYGEDLADRVRTVLPPAEAVTERQMFGGLAFMLDGHMFWPIPGAGRVLGWRPSSAVRSPMMGCGSSRSPHMTTGGWRSS